MIDVVIKFLDFVSMGVTVQVRRDPDEKNQGHGDPKRSVQIGPLEFGGFHRPQNVVSKVFRLVKMQKDPTDALDNVVRINVEIGLVGIQGQTRHATAPPRERTLLCRRNLLLLLWRLEGLLLLLHRLGRHEPRGHVGVDGSGNLLLHWLLVLLLLLDWWRLCELLLLLDWWRLRKLHLFLLLLHHWLLLELLLLLLHHWWWLLLRWTGSERVRLSTSTFTTTVAPEGIVPKKHIVVD